MPSRIPSIPTYVLHSFAQRLLAEVAQGSASPALKIILRNLGRDMQDAAEAAEWRLEQAQNQRRSGEPKESYRGLRAPHETRLKQELRAAQDAELADAELAEALRAAGFDPAKLKL